METIQEKVAELNRALGESLPYELVWIDPHEIELLEENAHYMRNDTFALLVANIKQDKALSSLPLLYQPPGAAKPKALSGNHRVMAAIAAKLTGILALLIRAPKTLEEQVAIQLSHNAIVGADDLPRLKALYERITNLDLKAYSGLDEETIQKLNAIKFEPVSEPSLAFKTATFLFLPEEIEEIREMVKHVEKLLADNDTFLFRLRDYHEFFEMMSAAKGKLEIKESAASIIELMRRGHRQLDDEAALKAAAAPPEGKPQ